MVKKEQPLALAADLVQPREDLVRAANQAAGGIAERAAEADRQRRVQWRTYKTSMRPGSWPSRSPKNSAGPRPTW